MIQVLKRGGIAGHQRTVDHLGHGLADLLIGFKYVHGIVIVLTVHIAHSVSAHTEDVYIIHSDLFTDLNIGAVHRTDGYGTVHHEFHIAGTACFLAGCGKLFRYFCRGDQNFSAADVIVLQENDLEHFTCPGMFFDQFAEGTDHTDDLFRTIVPGTCFRAEDKYSGLHRKAFVVNNAVIKHKNMKRVQHLTLIFMQALCLYVENKGRINDASLSVLQQVSQAFLIMLFDFRKLLSERCVVGKRFQFAQPFRIFYPVCAD